MVVEYQWGLFRGTIETAGRATLEPVRQLRERLRRAIGYRAWTQKDVTEAIGLSQKSMSKLMRGETIDPGASVVYAMAQELDVSTDFLYGLSDVIERR
jgi:transcriptional regulator with XRE-family HTH domain